MDQAALDAISTFLDRACKELGRYTVAFYKQDGEAWKTYGSGVLVRVADAYFIATARHVIDDALPQSTRNSDTHELVGRTNRPAHPLSEPRGGLRPSFSR